MTNDHIAKEGRILQQAIFTLLLERHPGHWSVQELVRTLVDHDEFAAQSAVITAIQDLYGAGVIHRYRDFVFLTQAATTTVAITE